MFYTTPIQFAAVVLRRSFYDQNEKFDTSLIHTADVDMWARAIFKGGGLYQLIFFHHIEFSWGMILLS
jgi:hypothetical protein